MDQDTYQRWWALHLRVARGEELGAEDQALYTAGRLQLEREEKLGQTAAAAGQARAAVASLAEQHAALVARRRQLDQEIATLEAALGQQTRQLLGVED